MKPLLLIAGLLAAGAAEADPLDAPGAAPGAMRPPAGWGTPPPGNPAAGTQFLAPLIGQWQGDVVAKGVPETIAIRFRPDGQYYELISFRQPTQLQDKALQVWGSWTLQPKTATTASLSLQPSRWEPAHLCATTGQCAPVNPQPSTIDIQALDANTIQSSLGVAKRVGKAGAE